MSYTLRAVAIAFSFAACVTDDVLPPELDASLSALVDACGTRSTLRLVESDFDGGPYVASHAGGNRGDTQWVFDVMTVSFWNGTGFELHFPATRSGTYSVKGGWVEWGPPEARRRACIPGTGSAILHRIADPEHFVPAAVIAVLAIDGEGEDCATPLEGTVLLCTD